MSKNEPVITKDIFFAEQPCTIGCDAQCEKAWGIGSRPFRYVNDPNQTTYGVGFEQEPEGIDDQFGVDDTYYLPDQELGIAPAHPGNWEGEDTKPQNEFQRLNKWCCRACERCEMVDRGQPIILFNFSRRLYNIEPHYRDDPIIPLVETQKEQKDERV